MEDDILEIALVYGITSASNIYKITRNEVITIVKRFMNEVSSPCPCEKEKLEGRIVMCFFCTGPEMSQSLKSFNWNS